MQTRPVDFHVSEYKNFINIVSDSTLQPTFKCYHLSSCGVALNKHMHNYLRNLSINIGLYEDGFFSIYLIKMRHNRLSIEANVRIQLSSIYQVNEEICKMWNNVTLLTKLKFELWKYSYFSWKSIFIVCSRLNHMSPTILQDTYI